MYLIELLKLEQLGSQEHFYTTSTLVNLVIQAMCSEELPPVEQR